MNDNRSIEQMRNLGPRCAGRLAQIEIYDEAWLQAIGALGHTANW